MKKILTTLFVALLVMQLSAQENLLTKGDKVLNVGIGIGSVGWGSGYTNSMLPLSASFEVGVKDDVFDVGSIGVGGFIGYSGYKYEFMTWQWKYTDLIIAARGSLHYPLVEKLDTYTGLSLGYESVTFKETGSGLFPGGYNTVGSGVFIGWHAGARYYFTDNFAAMGELGYGFTWLTLGVALKF
jgi:hypothetical protein